MPYPVPPPPHPPVIRVVSEESNDIRNPSAVTVATPPSSFLQPLVRPNIDQPGFSESLAPAVTRTQEDREGRQADLGSPVEIGLPTVRFANLSYVDVASPVRESSGYISQGSSEGETESPTEPPTEERPSVAPIPPLAPSDAIDGDSPGEVLVIPGQAEPLPSTSPTQPIPTQEVPGSPVPDASPATQPAPDIIELHADRQEYDEQNQVFRAEGNVELRFRQAVLTADRVQVNVPNRIAVADGNAVITRGQQVLRGDRIEYNLVQNQGTIDGARGELFLSTLSSDIGTAVPDDGGVTDSSTRPVGARVTAEQPLIFQGGQAGIATGVNTPNQSGFASTAPGQINRIRFEAEQIEFAGQNWEATNVRLTNDPFSPPELELRSPRVTVTPLSPTQTEIRARNPRLVFDQGLSVPLFRDRVVIDSRRRDSGLVEFGFDEDDRGGLFVERSFDIPIGRIANLRLTPQILVQRAIDQDGFFDGSSYGLISRLDITPSPTTRIEGNAVLTSLDVGADDFDDQIRASLRAQQLVSNHTVTLEYSYRDRLFNGSLGFQDVRSSLGVVVTSPRTTLGASGINLRYQGGFQYINSDANSERLNESDIQDRLPEFIPGEGRPNNRIDLGRYQVGVLLDRPFFLWTGRALPPTPDAGLRYTPNPIVPYVAASVGVRGVFSGYTNGDTQSVLTGTVRLYGQFGNFSRPFLDYTGFNISYSYNAVGGETPFNFDRVNDIQVLSLGLTQQIYGPVRFGINSTIFLESRNERENNTDTTFFLEYNRRTYSIGLSYSPTREAGALNFRINDFNWTGDPGPFSGLESDRVSGGIRVPGN